MNKICVTTCRNVARLTNASTLILKKAKVLRWTVESVEMKRRIKCLFFIPNNTNIRSCEFIFYFILLHVTAVNFSHPQVGYCFTKRFQNILHTTISKIESTNWQNNENMMLWSLLEIIYAYK